MVLIWIPLQNVAPKIVQLAIPDTYQVTPEKDLAVGILGRIWKAAILVKMYK